MQTPIARIFLAALELEEPTPEEFRLALESEAQAEVPLLKRFNVVFETIISLAPAGFTRHDFGIDYLASLKIGDVGGRERQVTGGISEALIATASSLII